MMPKACAATVVYQSRLAATGWMMLKACATAVVYQSRLAAALLDDAMPHTASIPCTIARSKRKLWAITKAGSAPGRVPKLARGGGFG